MHYLQFYCISHCSFEVRIEVSWIDVYPTALQWRWKSGVHVYNIIGYFCDQGKSLDCVWVYSIVSQSKSHGFLWIVKTQVEPIRLLCDSVSNVNSTQIICSDVSKIELDLCFKSVRKQYNCVFIFRQWQFNI